MKRKQELMVVPVKWLQGIQAVIVADRVYVAQQRTAKLTQQLARFVVERARLSASRVE